jgi:hypothetical protein
VAYCRWRFAQSVTKSLDAHPVLRRTTHGSTYSSGVPSSSSADAVHDPTPVASIDQLPTRWQLTVHGALGIAAARLASARYVGTAVF